MSRAAYGPTLAAGWGLRALGDFNHDSHPDYGLFALKHASDRDLVFIRTLIHRGRLRADPSQWMGIGGHGRF